MKKLILFIAAIAVLMVSSSAGAITSSGIGGRPANPQPNNPRTQSIFIYQLRPGATTSDAVRVFNDTNTAQTIMVYPVDAILSSGGAFGCAQRVDPRADVGSWITMSSPTVTVAPNSSTVVPFTVQVPSVVSVGEHDGCVVIQAAAAQNTSDKSGVVLSFRSAIRVAITIPGKIMKGLAITSVTVNGVKGGNYRIVPVLKNTGNVSLDATVRPEIVTLFGQVIRSTQGVYPVLPNSSASWNFALKRPFWGGLYRARVITSYNGNTSTLLGEGVNQSVVSKQSDSSIFLALPDPLAGIIELALVAAAAGVITVAVRRLRHRRHVRKHWRQYTVHDGDTLASLALARHISWKKIVSANKLKAPYSLQAGQTLKLPEEE